MSFNGLTRVQLVALCKERGIRGYSTKRKDELIALLDPSDSSDAVKTLTPLVKWCGGKGDEIKLFEQYIPTDYTRYIEPFMGGGAVYFHLAPTQATISDVHKELTDLYQSIKDGHAKEIYDFMVAHPNEEETYYEVRDRMAVSTPLENAQRFFYLRKTCYRGMMRYNKQGKFNIPFGRYKNCTYEELLDPKYATLLERTEVLNADFETVFQRYNDPGNFIFLDPPYDSVFTDYGYCQFGKAEHERLAQCFKESRSRCLMVIGKTDFIEALYEGYIVDRYDKKYRFRLHSGRVGDEIDNVHLVIKNY